MTNANYFQYQRELCNAYLICNVALTDLCSMLSLQVVYPAKDDEGYVKKKSGHNSVGTQSKCALWCGPNSNAKDGLS